MGIEMALFVKEVKVLIQKQDYTQKETRIQVNLWTLKQLVASLKVFAKKSDFFLKREAP